MLLGLQKHFSNVAPLFLSITRDEHFAGLSGNPHSAIIIALKLGFLMRVLLIMCSLLVAAAGVAHADEKVRFEAEPDWIARRPTPPAAVGKGDTVPSLLLQNNQTRFGKDGDDFYTDYAIQIRSAADLQSAGTVALDWRPDIETLRIHKIEIIRKGVAINAITSPKAVSVLRREKNLEEASLDGSLTATLQIEDLRIGDLVHVTYTLSRSDPVLAGHSVGRFGLARPGLVGRAYFRAVWPKTKDIAAKVYPGLEGVVRPVGEEATEFVFEGENLHAPAVPALAPARFQTVAQADFTEFKSYREVSRLFYPLYARAMELKADSPLKAEAAQIRAAAPDSRARALAALQLVESNTRYLFIGLNSGGYVPAAADLTWSRKYGDCKGKTVLLLALLKELQIEAVPVLVDSDGGDGLDQRAPSPWAFDHVIVRAQIDGKFYWLDATRLADYRLERPQFDAAFALPLTPDGSDLVKPPRPTLDVHEFQSVATYDARAGLDRPATAHVEHIYREDRGVAKGMALDSAAGPGLERELRDYWKSQIKWLHPTKVAYVFDRDHGVTTITADGEAELSWAKSTAGHELILEDSQVGWDVSYAREPGPSRDAPFAINFPYNRRWLVTVRLPDGGSGFQALNAADVDKTAAGFHFTRKTRVEGDTVEVDTIEKAIQEEFPASEAAAAERDLRQMASFDVIIRKAPSTAANTALNGLRTKLDDAVRKATSGDAKGARDMLDVLTVDPQYKNLTPQEQAAGWLMLAAVDTDQKDYPAAEKALKAGYATGQLKDRLQNVELGMRQAQGDMTAMAEVLSKMIPDRGVESAHLGDITILQIAREAKGEPARRYLEALLKKTWRPSDPFMNIDSLWGRLAAIEMDRGDVGAAASALEAIESPASLLTFKVDLTFTKAFDGDASRFDIDQALKRRTEALEAAVKAQPDRLSGVQALSEVYRMANRADEAVKLTQDAISSARASPEGKPLYSDQERQLPWTYLQNGRALWQLGRYEESLKSLERAAHRSSGLGVNAGLNLSLASALVDLNRATDALDETADVASTSLSAFGKMVRQRIVACANAQLGRTEEANRALAYLREHASDGAGQLRQALACTADKDELAKVLIAQLLNPDERQDVLGDMQNYPKHPFATAWSTKQRDFFLDVRDRADVKAALAKVGRIESFNLY